AHASLHPVYWYPIAIISNRIHPMLLCGNVHPTKIKIPFSKEKALIQLLESMIRQTLRSTSLIPKMEHQPKQRVDTEQAAMAFHTIPQEKAQPETDRTIADSFFEEKGNEATAFESFVNETKKVEDKGELVTRGRLT